MPIASKVLIPLVTVAVVVTIVLTIGVVEARNQHDLKVQRKAKEVKAAADEVEVIAKGSQEGAAEFEALAKRVLEGASEAARQEYDAKVRSGVDPQSAFEVAMEHFVETEVLKQFQQALDALIDIQKSPQTIDETQWEAANKAYQQAELNLKTLTDRLDEAYLLFFGEIPTEQGMRTVVTKGIGVEPMKRTLNHVQHLIGVQKAVFNTQISDGEKTLTQFRDRVEETKNEATKWQRAAERAEFAQQERTKERDQTKTDLATEQQSLATEVAKRDKFQTEVDTTTAQLTDVLQRCRQKVLVVQAAEKRVDSLRGLKQVVITQDGLGVRGQVQQVGADGTIRISLGARVGVKPGVRLHVYRFDPKPEYLGELEVTSSDSDGANGQMLPAYRQLEIRVGDRVATIDGIGPE